MNADQQLKSRPEKQGPYRNKQNRGMVCQLKRINFYELPDIKAVGRGNDLPFRSAGEVRKQRRMYINPYETA